MSTDLYEILEIQADATPEQIRKAYKKRALQTHPDRAPASDKTEAEERFRQVNHAYEILNDPQKRQSYDRHGTWPPPAEEPPRHNQYNTRSRPPHPHHVFTFTDPFELFESFFGPASPFHGPSPFGLSRTFPDPFFAPPGFPFSSGPFNPFGPFAPGVGMDGGGRFRDVPAYGPPMMPPPMMGGGFFQPRSERRPAPYFSSTSFSNYPGTGGTQWISESQSTSIINGLTTTVHERVDSAGNKHTSTTHPDGRTIFTINGVLQTSGQIDAPPHTYHSDRPELPRSHRPHHHRHRDHSRGRHERHGAYRVYDRDYSTNHRDTYRPNTSRP